MPIEYPSDLPSPLLNGYKLTPKDNTIRTRMDSGRIRRRQRYSTRNYDLSMKFLFTNEQLGKFDVFYKDTLLDGTQEFDMMLPAPSGAQMKLKVRFNAPYNMSASQTLWTVTCKADVYGAPKFMENEDATQ